GRHLSGAADIAPALRAYESERALRAQQLQESARANGRIYHLGGVPKLARNFVMRRIGGSGLIERQAWDYRHPRPEPGTAARGAASGNRKALPPAPLKVAGGTKAALCGWQPPPRRVLELVFLKHPRAPRERGFLMSRESSRFRGRTAIRARYRPSPRD